MNKEWQQALKRMRKEGLIVDIRPGGKHQLAVLPNGRKMPIMGTPSDHRSMRNTEAQMRRLAKL